MIVLSCSFFIAALLYASAGFGGGSTYNALLVLAETDYRILPSIALLCNLIVVSGGTYRFYRAGHVDFKKILPWIVLSVPAAWVGGYLHVSEQLFMGILGVSLFLAGLYMLFPEEKRGGDLEGSFSKSPFLPPIIGVGLGFLAGMVGIGGGIFLAPILYFIKWGNAKMIAGTCAVFIFVNSLSGLLGQSMKLAQEELFSDVLMDIGAYWMLFPAVFIGGQIGSYMGATRLDPKIIRFVSAIIILYVSIRLLRNFFFY